MTQPGQAQAQVRLAFVALIVATLAAIAVGLGVWLIAASHAWTAGCRVDQPLHTAGMLSVATAGLLNVAATITGLLSLLKPRPRGPALRMGAAALAIGAVGVIVCLLIFLMVMSPHAVDPRYLHPC